MARGTLLVTRVSPRPEVPGEQFVAITGVITGPTVAEHVVYQQMAVDTANWPTMGQLIPGGLLAEEPGQVGVRASRAALPEPPRPAPFDQPPFDQPPPGRPGG